MFEIAFLVPTTSKNQPLRDTQDLFLVKYLLTSFTEKSTKDYIYRFYIGYDSCDTFYKENKDKITELFPQLNLNFVCLSDVSRTLVMKWNELFKIAYNDNDFFYQLGDDVTFLSTGWENDFINLLSQSNFIGVVGPKDCNNTELLTQTFVSKRHYDIFNYYFDPSIENWFCDNWINEIYKPDFIYYSSSLIVNNSLQKPRYEVVQIKQEYFNTLVANAGVKLQDYLSNLKYHKVNINLSTEATMRVLSDLYVNATKNNYELVIDTKRIQLLGFKNLSNKLSVGEITDVSSSLSISEINQMRHQFYKYIVFGKKELGIKDSIFVFVDNPYDYLSLEEVILKFKNKWLCENVILVSDVNFSNYKRINKQYVVDYIHSASGIVYDINSKLGYELAIKYKIEHVLEIKPKFYDTVEYKNYFLPLSFDISKRKQTPRILGIVGNFNINIDATIYYKDTDESEKDFVYRILEKEEYVLIIRKPVLEIPFIDFNYILGVDLYKNTFLFIGDKRIIDIVYDSKFIIDNFPFYTI